jgi:hypothetical protein
VGGAVGVADAQAVVKRGLGGTAGQVEARSMGVAAGYLAPGEHALPVVLCGGQGALGDRQGLIGRQGLHGQYGLFNQDLGGLGGLGQVAEALQRLAEQLQRMRCPSGRTGATRSSAVMARCAQPLFCLLGVASHLRRVRLWASCQMVGHAAVNTQAQGLRHLLVADPAGHFVRPPAASKDPSLLQMGQRGCQLQG